MRRSAESVRPSWRAASARGTALARGRTGQPLNPETLRIRATKGTLVGVQAADDRRWYLPAWQFTTDRGRLAVRDAIVALWRLLPRDAASTWTHAAWMVSPLDSPAGPGRHLLLRRRPGRGAARTAHRPGRARPDCRRRGPRHQRRVDLCPAHQVRRGRSDVAGGTGHQGAVHCHALRRRGRPGGVGGRHRRQRMARAGCLDTARPGRVADGRAVLQCRYWHTRRVG